MAIGAASNALGTINDVAEAARLAHDAGALVFVDAVHYAPHRLVDVRAMDCDFLACSAYKFYGPHVGVLYGKHDLLQDLDVPKLRPAPDTAPERLETGTQNHEGIVGAAAAVEFLASLADGPDPAGSAPGRLRGARTSGARRWSSGSGEGSSEIEGVRLYGPPPSEPRTPTVSFTVDGIPSDEVCRRLADRGLFASHGDFYATTVVERLGLARRGPGPDRLRLLHHRGGDRPAPRRRAGRRGVGMTPIPRRRNRVLCIVPDRPRRRPWPRLPPLRPFVARLRGGLRRGHALGSGGLPRHRPDPTEGLDVAGRRAGDVVLGVDRGEPVVPRPVDRLDPGHDPGRTDPWLRLRLERPGLLRRRASAWVS